MVALGVDACKHGWIGISLSPDGSTVGFYGATMGELVAQVPDVEDIAIDIPIGLPNRGPRAADMLARKRVGSRRTSVFMTPVRAALQAPTHAEATAVSVRITGSGVSQQAYALRAKIFEVETWLRLSPVPVWEVHPEVCFAVLSGAPLRYSKTTWAGAEERRSHLVSCGIDPGVDVGNAGARGTVDDVLDAAAAAWSGRRLISGTAICLPEPPEQDAVGRAIAIWA
jgi:predicted RNase H-like nuclease